MDRGSPAVIVIALWLTACSGFIHVPDGEPDVGPAPSPDMIVRPIADAEPPPPDAAPRPDAMPPLPQCANGIDDDDDGFVDYPADPGCGSLFDDDESNSVSPALPQCSNGIDDDSDGLVDLADPGCSSVADPREALPLDAPEPGCANGRDDDADGLVDFPHDPGCSAAGDEDEADPAAPPACFDGVDNDDDGWTDYPDDPGCQGRGDGDETDPEVTPACSDGVDNDDDGIVDYPDDRDCESAADTSERGPCGRVYEADEVRPGQLTRGDSRGGAFESEGSCGGRGAPEVVFVHRVERPIEALLVRTDLPENQLESTLYVRHGCLDPDSEVACAREEIGDGVAANRLRVPYPTPGQYFIFVDGATGRGGEFALVIDEVPLAECLNGEDDDEDGRVDYPMDPGCAAPADRDESDPDAAPACADGLDNDGDGAADFPLDAGCYAAADPDELDPCGEGVRTVRYPAGEASVGGAIAFGGGETRGSCGGDGGEVIVEYDNPSPARLFISVDHPETRPGTAIYVRTACLETEAERACDAGDPDGDARGTVVIEQAEAGTWYVVVDRLDGQRGDFRLTIDAEPLPDAEPQPDAP